MGSNNKIQRISQLFGYLAVLEKKEVSFVSSKELANAIGATEYTVRKDFSLLNIKGYTRKGYEVSSLKQKIGKKFLLNQKRSACIVGLGRLGSALLDYEKFQEDGFEIIAGFDSSINKIERIQTHIDVFPIDALPNIVKDKKIELGIITVPEEAAQEIADILNRSGVKGILNFSPAKISVPKHIVHLDMDFTGALRFIAARLTLNKE